MTTNQSSACLTAESMERLAQGELQASEMVLIEEHIGTCESCRSMLDSSSFDSVWHDDVLPVLQGTSEDGERLHEGQGDGHDEQSLESVLKLLGPTDDPHKIGRIGTYEVIGVIGRGGMGVVFKALDAALNRFVAIKMLLPHLAVSGAARKRFAREGQAAAAVIDDNVLPIYSVAEWQGVPYLVTQYSRGTTLQKRIQDQGPLELKEILRIGMQTARGLAAAHAQGLVHRDVKPSNILLDGTVERALLTDFGLARAVDDASITRTGVIAGTPQYMSPEQARGGSVDARSDLFGLGCVLYTMCTGRPPFRAENSYAVLRLITDAEPRPIREINPEIPEWLCRLINRLMAKLPNDRFTSAAEVATLLEQCLAHVQQPTVAPVPEQLQAKKTASQRMRIGRSMVAIGAMLIGLLGLFGFVISIQSQDGTLLIESSVDDVTVRVSQGETIVRKLTVTKAGTKIDVAAGNYTVAIEGNVDGIAIENDKVNLRRGDTEIVKLTYQRPPEPTRTSNLDAHKLSPDVQHIIERTILHVTDVRAAGQVLYFKLHRRGDEPPVNARLKIQSHYEKPVEFVWSGPIGADIDVMPGGVAEIALPLIPAQGTKVALLFPDDETALVAARQLSSIGDRSLLLEQQQANLGTGEQKRDGIIHGVHPTGGRYSIEFSIVFDSTTASSLNISDVQRPQFTGVNWRPMYLANATHHHTAKRHALSESQEQEIRKLFDEFTRTATVETHDQLLKLTQAKIQEVLTREQDEAVRREIWLGWNVTKFRDPKRLAQLQISDKQQQQIDAIWQALERQTGQIQDPSSSPNIPEFFRPHRFAVEGPAQWQRVFDEIFAILTIQQRGMFLSEIQDPIVDGLLTDPRQRALAVPHGVIHEIPASTGLQMQQAFPTVNWRQLYIGRAMEPQLAKQYQITADQQQRMHEIAQAFLREATPATRETQEKYAQSAIQALLSQEQDQLLRKEIWLAVNASRLRSSAVHDQLGLDIHQRRQIDEAFEKFQEEAQQNNGWMADGTDSHQSLFDDILAVLTAKQRELYFNKLQDPVFDSAIVPPTAGVPDAGVGESSANSAPLDATLQSQLQGVWRLSGWAENEGELEKVADPADDFRQIVFRGNIAELTLVEGRSARFTYTINASSSPAAIDWKPEGTDLTLLGLVELSNGTLKLSMSNNETPVSGRPRRLAPEKGSGYYEFRRDAPFDLNAVLPSEGIIDLNVLSNSTEEAKVRMANRRLRDPNAALLAELQGTWLRTAIVSPEGTIEPVSDPVGTGHSIHFKDSTVALYQNNDEEPLPLKFTIDASTPTPEIDIEGHDGIFTLGLIETLNGTLHLKLGEAGGKRPSDSITPAVHYQYRRIPASLVALGEQKTEGALNPEDVQQQDAVIREANRQLKDPNRVLLAQLQGSWTATAMILPNGQLGTVSKPAETGMMIRFDDKSGCISQGKGDDESKFTYTIDASTSPAEIDLKHTSGTQVLGLLEIKNGTLELQLGAVGDERPSAEVKPSIHQLYRRTSFYWQWIPARE